MAGGKQGSWDVELLEELRQLLVQLVRQGGGVPADDRPVWERD